MEELKVKDLVQKAELAFKTMSSCVSHWNVTNTKAFEMNRTEGFKQNNREHERMQEEFETKMRELKLSYDNEVRQYILEIRELKANKESSETDKIRRLTAEVEEKSVLLDQMMDVLQPLYDKYFYSMKYKKQSESTELEVCYFSAFCVDKLYGDNKYLLELVSNSQRQQYERGYHTNQWMLIPVQNRHSFFHCLYLM